MPDALELTGLDGANPLGFLAALGTLALCDRLSLQPRMAWHPHANSYRPRLWISDTAALAEKITDILTHDLSDAIPPWCQGDIIKRSATAYRQLTASVVEIADRHRRHDADFIAAYASEAATEDKSDDITPTRLSFANGQSGKLLLRDYRDLVQALTSNHVQAALFQSWRNADACKTFRWEPRDLRLYALRAENPATSTVYSTLGGNVLAFWALTLLPSFPDHRGDLLTTAFARLPEATRRADFFTWPIWTTRLNRDTTASLLAYRSWHETTVPTRETSAMGIPALYRCKRINYQKSLYFSPASIVPSTEE